MKKTKSLVESAIIGAAYVALCFAFMPFAYEGIQLRVAEALTILPLLFGTAVPGLFVGCVIANFYSPFFIIDVVFGSIATLLGALGTYHVGKRISNRKWKLLIAPLCPCLSNALIVGGVLTYVSLGTGEEIAYFVLASQIFIGEVLACYGLGIPLFLALEKGLQYGKMKKE